MNIKHIAAAIIQKDGKILLAQRGKQGDPFYGLWEFPGGKVEQGETLQECLRRELQEELGIDALVGAYFATSQFMHKDILYEMSVFTIDSYVGDIVLHEHLDMHWVERKNLSQYPCPQADLPIIALLQQQN